MSATKIIDPNRPKWTPDVQPPPHSGVILVLLQSKWKLLVVNHGIWQDFEIWLDFEKRIQTVFKPVHVFKILIKKGVHWVHSGL